MKGLIWNCRGIRKTGVSSFLKDLIQEHQFHFIGLQETIVGNLEDHVLAKLDPRKNYLWKWIPARGRSGGILTGINMDKLEVGSFREGKYMLQMNLWDKALKLKWNFLNVYGAAQEENKDEFLAELASFCDKSLDPLLVGGDFNLIRFASEKNRNNGFHKHTDLFNSIIASQELLEIHMTWWKVHLVQQSGISYS